MPLRLDQRDPGFADAFKGIVERRREETVDVGDAVRRIIADVRQRGDAAVLELTARFDRLTLDAQGLRFSADEIAAARAGCAREDLAALEFAAARIRSFHERQLPQDIGWTDALGVRLGLRWTAIEAVGLYVPGGTAAYPSSVLMNAIPARVAGCSRVVMVVPTPDGVISPLVLAAASLAGIDEIYRIGGAQAVAALAYGTASIAPVDKIMGPGNAYVAEAKRQVFGRVGIDMIAGPSEVLVVADGGNRPDWIAADLLAQAEHDGRSESILMTDDAAFAAAVEAAVEAQLATLDRQAIARASWQEHGVVIVLGTLDDAPGFIDRLAPEHLELAVAEPGRLAAAVRNAGSVFLGARTPEVIGDYVGGPNHVLPTNRSARFASGLSVFDFLKRTTLLGCDQASLAVLGPPARRLATCEGLGGHARAVALRLD